MLWAAGRNADSLLGGKAGVRIIISRSILITWKVL